MILPKQDTKDAFREVENLDEESFNTKLRSRKIDFNAKDHLGNTILQSMAKYGFNQDDAFENALNIASKEFVDSINNSGQTLLECAIKCQRTFGTEPAKDSMIAALLKKLDPEKLDPFIAEDLLSQLTAEQQKEVQSRQQKWQEQDLVSQKLLTQKFYQLSKKHSCINRQEFFADEYRNFFQSILETYPEVKKGGLEAFVELAQGASRKTLPEEEFYQELSKKVTEITRRKQINLSDVAQEMTCDPQDFYIINNLKCHTDQTAKQIAEEAFFELDNPQNLKVFCNWMDSLYEKLQKETTKEIQEEKFKKVISELRKNLPPTQEVKPNLAPQNKTASKKEPFIQERPNAIQKNRRPSAEKLKNHGQQTTL